jgi:hypothetical protein
VVTYLEPGWTIKAAGIERKRKGEEDKQDRKRV